MTWCDRDCPESTAVGTGSTSVLGWLAGAEHGQGTLAGTGSRQVWQFGEMVVARWGKIKETG